MKKYLFLIMGARSFAFAFRGGMEERAREKGSQGMTARPGGYNFRAQRSLNRRSYGGPRQVLSGTCGYDSSVRAKLNIRV